jgi:2-oxoglutarate dehydrogenase E2 component (dihydrolipoamide succinyltransferase)
MIIEIKVPSPGESITEVELARWLVEDNSIVEKDQELAEVESDKATLPVLAEKSGKLKIITPAGTTVAVGTVVCSLDTSFSTVITQSEEKKTKVKTEENPSLKSDIKTVETISAPITSGKNNIKITPLARKLMDENGLNTEDIINGLKKITTTEVNQVLNSKALQKTISLPINRNVKREKMSQLRRKISERLVAVKNETAMLTTFNEVDMSAIIELRNKYQKTFSEKYNIKLGFMSFFTKAVSVALGEFPRINSFIEGDEIVNPGYSDIGIAVQTDKGLMVPVLRNTESLSIPQIELQLAEVAKKARAFRLSPEEMSGGTFTITNGGVFGSLLSTPILNPPQSGILGMHNIVDRPVALNGQVVIRPMMYVALSYDHRIVDGKDSVSFLVRVKELLETPIKLLIEEAEPGKALLGL